ncbi:MAG: PfkB family carbohydrate kinase, partial [Acidimicrobiales bacterium]
EWLVGGLGRHGVDTSLVQLSPRSTGRAFITVAPGGDNQIVVSPGANADLDLAGVDLAGFDVVLAQLEVGPEVVEIAAATSRALVLNAAPAGALGASTLARCAVVIVNEVESASFDVASLAHCVVTLGAAGAVHWAHGREVARAPAPKVVPVDTVGAGDVFCAAYALRYAEGAAPDEALAFAVTAGSLATRARGAQGALPSRREVESWR